MPTLSELGIDLYELTGKKPESDKSLARRLTRERFLREQKSQYEIVDTSSDQIERYGALWPRLTFTTAEEGIWQLVLVDPEGKFTTEHNRSWRSIDKLSTTISMFEDFAIPAHPEQHSKQSDNKFRDILNDYNTRQQHNSVQIFLWSNWDRLAREVFSPNPTPMHTPLPCHLEVVLHGKGHTGTPDLIGILPDTRPHILEIGNSDKKPAKVNDYVKMFSTQFGEQPDNILSSIVRYHSNGIMRNIEIITGELPPELPYWIEVPKAA